jgi:DNA-binding CsgD family transcriptional regulator
MASIRLWAPSTPVQTIDLAQCWHELASGRQQIADSSASEEHYFLLLTRCAKVGRARRGIRARNFGVLNRVLLTPSRKQLSLEVGLSTSSIAALSKQCLELIGLSCTPYTVPPLLIMAASAASTPISGQLGVSGERWTLAPHFEVIRAPRPELEFASAFSRAEFDVAQRLLEGNSYAQIARHRRTSTRTIANQVASIFNRVGVSSRHALAQRLLIGSVGLGQTRGAPLQ